MEVELLEIRQFLQRRPPFDRLSENTLNQLVEQLQITYLRRDKPFPLHDNRFYILRSGAIELYASDGDVCDQLDEGGIYASGCTLLRLEDYTSGRAIEDSLLYMGSCHNLYRLSQEVPAFGDYFTASVRQRLQAALAALQTEQDTEFSNQQPVSEILRKTPICLEVNQDIQSAARLMSEQGISSLLLVDQGQLVGIVTDRDIRKRCVAAGLSVNTPVCQIMTRDPFTIAADTPLSEALLHMTRLRVHHLPVMDGDKVLGMFTATDLVLNQGGSAALLANAISKAQGVDELVESGSRIPQLHHHLARSGANVAQIGETLSYMTDAITARLLQLAEAELGPSPVPYVWLAGGSQGRQEQSSHSDQDNALLISDAMRPEHEPYFAELARRVTDGLNACGFVYCPGDAMASNPQWRQPLAGWAAYFDRWIGTPEPMALMLSSIWFDLRPVHGHKELFEQMQERVLHAAAENQIFLAYMMANALKHRPPLGFFRQFVLVRDGSHDDTLDLKHSGIVPLTDIARVLALSGGIGEVNTLQRLRAAQKKGLLSEEMADNLQSALELIAGLRMRHQAEQIARGESVDNFLAPNQLPSLERSHLKDAFRVIQTQQEVMMKRFGAENLR